MIVDSEAIERLATEGNPDLAVKCRAMLAQFQLPDRGLEGARAATAAMAGACLVAGMARLAVEGDFLAPASAAMVESMAARVMDALALIVTEEIGAS